jgi:hypothetical protein
MASLQDLQSAIDQLLNHPLGAGNYQLVRAVEEKAYEAYVFGLCLKSVRDLGVIPTLRGISGPPIPFVFRGGPGQIHSDYRNYGYADFTLNGRDFEIHAGIEFRGTSGMTHELDVCIMRAEDAAACRQQPDDPASSSLIAAWECKFYDNNLDKVLGRAFVGLMDDMGSNIRLSGLCSNQTHPQLHSFLQPSRRPYPHLVLSPLIPASERRFVGTLSAEIKKMSAA